MKRGFIFSALLCAVAVTLDAQVRQEGTAVLQNSGHQPLAGVQVMAVGAAPASSDGNGRFFLEFRSGRPGDMLKVNDIYKSGYSLVNEAALRNWRISGDRPVEVVLCPTDVLLNRQEEYYGVGREHYQSRYEAALVALDSLQKAGLLAREEYEARLDAAGAEYADAMNRLEEYAYMIACINTDDLNELEREVYALIRDGDVSGALQLLDRAQVSERFRRLQSMGEEAGEDLEAMIPSMKYYADICMFDGGKDNLLKARSVLEEIALSDTTNYVYAQEYAEALAENFLDYEEAVHWLGVALRHVAEPLAKIEVASDLGGVYVLMADYDRALEAFGVGLNLSVSDSTDADMASEEYFIRVYTEMIRDFSLLDYAMREFEESLNTLNSILEMAQYLYALNPGKYAFLLGTVISDMASVITESRGVEDYGLQCAALARQAFREVPRHREMETSIEIIDSYLTSVVACSNSGRYDMAKLYADSAMTLIQKYEIRNPIQYVKYRSLILDFEGTLIANQGDWPAGFAKIKEALEVASTLSESSMVSNLASIYYHLSVLGEELLEDKEELACYAAKACEMSDRVAYMSYHPFNVGSYMIYVDVLLDLGELRKASDSLFEIVVKIMTIAEEQGQKLPLEGLKRFVGQAARLAPLGNNVREYWRDMFTDMLKAYPPSAEKREVRKLVDAL